MMLICMPSYHGTADEMKLLISFLVGCPSLAAEQRHGISHDDGCSRLKIVSTEIDTDAVTSSWTAVTIR